MQSQMNKNIATVNAKRSKTQEKLTHTVIYQTLTPES